MELVIGNMGKEKNLIRFRFYLWKVDLDGNFDYEVDFPDLVDEYLFAWA